MRLLRYSGIPAIVHCTYSTCRVLSWVLLAAMTTSNRRLVAVASGADWGVEDGEKSSRAAELERPAVVFVAEPQARSFPRQQSPARSNRRSVLPGAA